MRLLLRKTKSKLERIYPNPRPNLQSHLFKGFINEKGDIEIDLNIFTTEKPVVNEGN